MGKVLDRADEVLLEGRERVHDLRQDEISANELPERLAICGEELRQDYAIRFSLSVIGSQQSLDAMVGNEVYRIGQEALTNAFQHSRSSKIEVEITYDHSRLRLRIRDDGVGINHDVLHRGRDGHWGLPGMRERSQKIGGQLRIWSQEGAGTEIELTVPGAIAYPLHSKKLRWHWVKSFLGSGR
jgi:signal transduction histidine kinase